MKKYIFILLILIGANTDFSFAQEVKVNAIQKNDSILIDVIIPEGWHLYSQFSNPKIGPIPTEITFSKNDAVKLIGSVQEPDAIEKYDKNFQGDIKYFNNQVRFSQKIKLSADVKLTGTIMYMICNNEMCMPPIEKEFIINLKK